MALLPSAGPRPALARPSFPDLPAVTRLALPSPSPGRGAMLVRFDLAGPELRRVRLEIFDVTGRRVRRLVADDLPGGRYGANWDGRDESGRVVAAGVYFVRLSAGDITQVRKAVRVR